MLSLRIEVFILRWFVMVDFSVQTVSMHVLPRQPFLISGLGTTNPMGVLTASHPVGDLSRSSYCLGLQDDGRTKNRQSNRSKSQS